MVVFDLSTQFIVPFLFVFAIIFGLLELASPIKNKGVNVVITFVIAYFATSYGPFATILWSYLPSITWFFIIMFFLAFGMEIFGVRGKKGTKVETLALTGAVFFILMAVGWIMAEQFPVELPVIGGTDNLILLLGILFILMLFWGAFKLGAMSEIEAGVEEVLKGGKKK